MGETNKELTLYVVGSTPGSAKEGGACKEQGSTAPGRGGTHTMAGRVRSAGQQDRQRRLQTTEAAGRLLEVRKG